MEFNMIKKCTLILTLVIILLISGCTFIQGEESNLPESGEGAGEKPLIIGFTLPTLQFPYYVRMHETFVDEAEIRGWEVIYADGNLDALTQVNASLDLLTKNIDVLVMNSWWREAMTEVYDIAEDSGLPLFMIGTTIDSIPEGSGVDLAVGTVDFDAGVVGGKWMAEHLHKQGKSNLNLIFIRVNDNVGIQRCEGFLAGLEESGIDVNVLNEYIGDTRENAMASMEDAMVTYPEGEINLVFGYSAQSGLGAYDAVVAANRSEIEIVGFDGEDDEKALIDKGTQYIATIEQYPREMAKATIEFIEKIVVNGEDVEVDQPIPAGVYDGN
jgi:ABC-type sugar transport system substrate-binding protein